MSARRRYPVGRQASGDLDPEVVNVLLQGWGAPQAEASPDRFAPFDLTDEDFRRLYRENRAALVAEFRRRKLPGKPWAATRTTQGDERMKGTGR